MTRVWFTIRVSLAMASLTLSLMFLAYGMGWGPNPDVMIAERRSDLARTLSLEVVHYIGLEQFDPFQTMAKTLVAESQELKSIGLRKTDGRLVVNVGEHDQHWQYPGQHSTPEYMFSALLVNNVSWGRLELTFEPIPPPKLWGLWPGGLLGQFFVVVSAGVFIGASIYFWFMLSRIFRENPTTVPTRIRRAFDALAEAVVVVDRNLQITYVNQNFAELYAVPAESLVGSEVAGLGWLQTAAHKTAPVEPPWISADRHLTTVFGATFRLRINDGTIRPVSVNAAPIISDQGEHHGTLITIDDLSELEQKNSALRMLLTRLKVSRARIHRQNRQLKILASCDSLTKCLNRRAFFAEVDPLFQQSAVAGAALSCLMVDIDKFKAINDTYGHAAGDVVIAGVADLLRKCTRDSDLICRYGGEEFAIILPHTDREGALVIAERIRTTIEATPMADITVTVSIGLTSLLEKPETCPAMFNQADKALYAAKHQGRNRVICSDSLSI